MDAGFYTYWKRFGPGLGPIEGPFGTIAIVRQHAQKIAEGAPVGTYVMVTTGHPCNCYAKVLETFAGSAA